MASLSRKVEAFIPSAAAAAVLLPPAVRKARSKQIAFGLVHGGLEIAGQFRFAACVLRRRGNAGHFVCQQVRRDVAAADQIGPLQGVGQLADIARPIVLQEPIARPRLDLAEAARRRSP